MKAKEKELMRKEVMGEALDDQKPQGRKPKKTFRKKTKPEFGKTSGESPEE